MTKELKISILILIAACYNGIAQAPVEDLAAKIEIYKNDVRGPYKDIRWFCADGTFNDPKTPCNQEGSVQRARYKDEVETTGLRHHIFLGQILSATNQDDFWDKKNYFSRFKQYQLEQYLKIIDDGWINRKAQFYRGALQTEDETAWGKAFLIGLLSNDQLLKEEFFIIRQAVQSIPHDEDDNTRQLVRALSKNISDEDPRFMNLRVKIHGQPDRSDILLTEKFMTNHPNLKKNVQNSLQELIALMTQLYAPLDAEEKIKMVKLWPASSAREMTIEAFNRIKTNQSDFGQLIVLMDAIRMIRDQILTTKGGAKRLNMMDVSIDLESVLLNNFSEISTNQVGDIITMTCYLNGAAYGTGFIEAWEWEYLQSALSICQGDEFYLKDLVVFHQLAQGGLEWSTNMVRAHYNPVINTWGTFEPLSYGFIDNLIRSSPLLILGQQVNKIGEWLANESKLKNEVPGISQQSQIRGLNPGYARGELVVVSGDVTDLSIDKRKIYLFDQPPSDLKPIAGIATVSEGNPVSHIQLLARNLGIPNSVISIEAFKSLKAYNGREMFYAVSPGGTVILKPSSAMTSVERKLFEQIKRDENKITVPIDKLQLSETAVLDLGNIDKSFSGIVSGPKAANLGELKKLFPDKVVDGLVIPFGIFKVHMDQKMPGNDFSYWDYLNETFEIAAQKAKGGASEEEVESYQIKRLTALQESIKSIAFLPSFEKELEDKFVKILRQPMGKLTVFLRSDTNMEDLKDFTGAGLNLTVFNVLEKSKILQGIRDVWASPYSERSFKWRQKYLLNPENVFPSILVIPSVNVDYSGVIITKGIRTNQPNDITIAFSRGVGGAVDGQAAESYLISSRGQAQLEAPSRESTFKYLPSSGGTKSAYTSFSQPILNEDNLDEIRNFVLEARRKIKMESEDGKVQALDIELGFLNNKMWLFQVRPFVENKNALSSEYLSSITPPELDDRLISYTTKI